MEADKKYSPVWKHFTVAEDDSFAICKHCQKEVPRGGKCKKSYNTTNLVNHLKEHRVNHSRFTMKTRLLKQRK